MADLTPAQIEQRRALKLAVRERRATPAEAEAQAIGMDLPPFIAGYEDRHDITSNSTWWLPVALLFYAWRDLPKTRREYERFDVWGRDLWREGKSHDAVMSLQEAEQMLRYDLLASVVRSFGTNTDHELTAIPAREWRELRFAGNQPLSACGADGSIVYSGAFVLRHEVVPLWLQETPATLAAPRPEQRVRSGEPEPKKRAGGRPAVHDWDAMWIEVVRLATEDKITDRPALSKHLLEWFSERGGIEPGESALKEKMSKLFTTLGW